MFQATTVRKKRSLVSRAVRKLNSAIPHQYCTPRGVRNFGTLENYKHVTPPE